MTMKLRLVASSMPVLAVSMLAVVGIISVRSNTTAERDGFRYLEKATSESALTGEMAANIALVATMATETTANLGDARQAADTLAAVSKHLRDLVSEFRV